MLERGGVHVNVLPCPKSRVHISPAHAGSVQSFAKDVSVARVLYKECLTRHSAFKRIIHKVAAAAGSHRPASAGMQMSRSDARAARLDEDDTR